METQKLSLIPLTMLVTGNMMGAGIFLLPSSLAGYGSVALLGWVVTVLGAVMLSLVFVRLDALSRSGSGLYAFTRDGLGRYAGSQVVYGYWVAIWVGNTAVALSGVGYLSYFFPILTNQWVATLAAVGVIWALSCLNMRNIRMIGRFQIATTSCMLIPVLIVGVLGWSVFDKALLTGSFNVTGLPFHSAISESLTITLWSFIGLESACNLAGHARNPKRDVPFATFFGTLLAAILYILSTTAMMGVVPNDVLQSSAAPFSVAASYILGDWAGELVSAMAVIACFGSLNGWILMHGQVARSACADGLLPGLFGKLNKHGSPKCGLLVTAVLMSILLLLTIEPTVQKHFELVILIAVHIMLLAYICACVSCLILQRRHLASVHWIWHMVIILALIYCGWSLSGAGNWFIVEALSLVGAGSLLYWQLVRKPEDRANQIDQA